jgi:hypothetical protein
MIFSGRDDRVWMFGLSQLKFVSYLPIKPRKSLKNKDFTSKSLFLKDLGKISR